MVVQGTIAKDDGRRLSVFAPAEVVIIEAGAIERPGIRFRQRDHWTDLDGFAGFEAACGKDASTTTLAIANCYVSHMEGIAYVCIVRKTHRWLPVQCHPL